MSADIAEKEIKRAEAEIEALVAAAFDLVEYVCAIELARIRALNRPEVLPEVVRAVYVALLPFKKDRDDAE